ncbi:lipid II flippase MurJ, partial [Klebsiella variicola]
FDNDSVVITANYLRGMAIGLWAQLIGYIFIKALNAHMQNKKVLMAVSLSVLVNIAGNLLLYKNFGAYGIGIGASLNGLLLYFICSTYLGIINKVIKPLIIMVFILTLYS